MSRPTRSTGKNVHLFLRVHLRSGLSQHLAASPSELTSSTQPWTWFTEMTRIPTSQGGTFKTLCGVKNWDFFHQAGPRYPGQGGEGEHVQGRSGKNPGEQKLCWRGWRGLPWQGCEKSALTSSASYWHHRTMGITVKLS